METTGLYEPITQLLLRNEQEYADKIYLRQPRKGHWQEYSWREVMRQARQVAAFLKKIGLKKGAHVSIYSKNCAEWMIADFGISLAGLVSVPLFPNQHEDSIAYVLNHAEVELVIIGKLDQHKKAREAIPRQYPTLNFSYHPNLDCTHQWKEVLELEPLEAIPQPKPDDLYTIIYSSGTSALPKGAMFTHQAISNYLQVIRGDIRRIYPTESYRLLSYLPLPHVYERATTELLSLSVPSEVSFVESLDSFAENLREVKPTIFAAVPRIWDVFKNKISQKLPAKKLALLLRIPIVSGIVKRKIKQQLGLQECAVPISGAAHLPVDIIQFFDKVGICIQEGYGQTENLSYGTLSMKNQRKLGFVGTPRFDVQIKMGEQNELLLYSPCLMSGYFKDPESSKAAFTKDGFLHTGDIVEIDNKQRVKILGRISENFKNQKGEFISPTPIEKLFQEGTLIDQLCLVGRELVSNVLLVSLSPEGQSTSKTMLKSFLQDRLKSTNSKLQSHEKISQVLVINEPWSIENGLLTPTLKVKRRAVEERYHDFIHDAVKQGGKLVWED